MNSLALRVDTLETMPPAPGHSAIIMGSYGRVVFTPPEAIPFVANLAALGAFRAEPLGDGRAILRGPAGESWGVYANETMAASTAERLSR